MKDGEQDPASEVGASQLRDVMNLLSGAFYVLDEAGHFILWNEQVERATGLEGDRLRAVHMLELFPPDERLAVARAFCSVLEDHEHVELRAHLQVDGQRVPYIFFGACLLAGQRRYLLGNAIDLPGDSRQSAALALRERALHAASNGIVITRCDGVDNPIEYVNPAFERITGYSHDDVVGRDSRFMDAEDLDHEQREQLAAAIAEHRPITVVMRTQRKNGEQFWNHLAVTPVRDGQGQTTHFIGILEDITELKQRTAQLEHQVTHDALTGLANRTLLRDRMEQAMLAARRSGRRVAVILMDLNKFKHINDTMGHEAGDRVLAGVGHRLRSAVRDTDTVARLGGDEFVLVLSDQPSLRFTLAMIGRIRAALAEELDIGHCNITVGASMGVAIYPSDGDTFSQMLCAADAAMYEGKKGGSHAVHFYSPEMAASAEARQNLEQALRDALSRDQIYLMYQPNVCVATGRLLGLEALLRWRHPQLGELLPGAFLPDAEENGLIVPLGRRVLEEACGLITRLSELGYPGVPVSINASRREFSQRDYLPYIAERLAQHRVDPNCVELEMREAQLLHDPDQAQRLSARMHKMGLRLSLDEFGGGVSNLKCLRALAIDHLKMSSASVREICPLGHSGALAKTMLDIGQNLNIEVVATGVETQAQRDFLAAHGCASMQGHYVSQPLDGPALERWLGGRRH
ncbi:putative bifunctional diguanylate cyclase/phosphodiesterase [Pseudoduganella namucuonensis]|uniref:PAS domain S-box-containing protein/diguanylate cyclase (GGDEF) domain-containing protein n=1 Tax=Pseudoduganella namucuonensis TaxID=1035707 RepID=A0A1I7LB45_9BURK|nr:EAL domain-containing protein [Pseudoduganella namucuonensis]SFV06947.1 PAS domain S-box-containing protein/diguanylate cyclase (GGDEF) domain-containing protein [Pseudoduganella namucuonensis]